jgi:hypothetical protein
VFFRDIDQSQQRLHSDSQNPVQKTKTEETKTQESDWAIHRRSGHNLNEDAGNSPAGGTGICCIVHHRQLLSAVISHRRKGKNLSEERQLNVADSRFF